MNSDKHYFGITYIFDASCATTPGRFFSMLAESESALLEEGNVFVLWTDDKSNATNEPIQAWVSREDGVCVLISIMVILMSSSSNILADLGSYKPKTDEEKTISNPFGPLKYCF
jgi:outer membrane lipoprotein-sorting protein